MNYFVIFAALAICFLGLGLAYFIRTILRHHERQETRKQLTLILDEIEPIYWTDNSDHETGEATD